VLDAFTPATELAARVRRRDISPVELVDAFLARIEARGSVTNAYITLIPEGARRRAREAERAVMAGADLGPLHGVPIAVKDTLDVRGTRTTFGSRAFMTRVAPGDSTEVQRLQGAGAIILGKTNLPEFACKGTTDNLFAGPTSTPFAPGRNSGGSSGGSAAAVADGLAALAQGSDGGGSIRIPASCCGVVGVKATFGRVASATRPDAYYHHTPFLHSGPLARTVDDAALMLSVLAGPHDRDPFSLPDDGSDPVASTRRSVAGLRVGYSADFGGFPVDPAVRAVVDEAVGALGEAGAVVEPVVPVLPAPHGELAEMWVRMVELLYASMADDMARGGTDLMGEHRDELTPEMRGMIERGSARSAVVAKRDDVIRTSVFDAVQDVLDGHDLLVTPTLAVPPPPNADDGSTRGPAEVGGEPVDPLIGWCLTYPLNFSGHPAASVPAGLTPEGLPVGMQIVGRRFDESTVLAAAAAVERVRPWAGAYPGGAG
jgi:Asp-tRNA(Asn)/Glu-tRNA(Gln) amidotransferase A subunit family amidase